MGAMITSLTKNASIPQAEKVEKVQMKLSDKVYGEARFRNSEIGTGDKVALGLDTASVGASFIPGVGSAAAVGLGLAATAVQAVTDVNREGWTPSTLKKYRNKSRIQFISCNSWWRGN